MVKMLRSGGVAVLVVVAAWRAIAELVARHRALAASGRLAGLVAGRREQRFTRALAKLGIVAAPVPAPVHASVHVGGIRAGDVDDVGLLEGAMRRAARDRVIEAAERELVGRSASFVMGDRELSVPAWALVIVASGAALTVAPLVRPLADAAPWLALAGGALALCGWLAARR